MGDDGVGRKAWARCAVVVGGVLSAFAAVPDVRAAEPVHLVSWSVTVNSDRSFDTTIVVGGGDGLAGDDSYFEFDCDDADGGQLWSGISRFGAGRLREGTTNVYDMRISALSSTAPTAYCHFYELRLYGEDGSEYYLADAAAIADAGFTLEFVMPGPDEPGSLSVAPLSAAPGSTFTLSYRCVDDDPSAEVHDSQGNVVTNGVDVGLPTTGNFAEYSQAVTIDVPGSFTFEVTCGARLMTAGPVIAGARYVALGDSYASGEGAETFEPGTDEGDEGNMCHRAPDGWARGAATQLSLTVSFVACSGAVIPDLYQPNNGNGDGEIAQLTYLTTEADLVTISIGGNDVDFAGVLADCVYDESGFAPGSSGCRHRQNTAVTEALQRLRVGQPAGCEAAPGPDAVACSPSLADVYRDIHERAPSARIRVMAYPALWGGRFDRDRATNTWRCQVGTLAGFDSFYVDEADARWMNEVAQQLNRVLSDAVEALRTEGIDIAIAAPDPNFRGHRLCDRADPWFRALDLTIFQNFSFDNRSFHPNDVGQDAQYETLIAALTSRGGNGRRF